MKKHANLLKLIGRLISKSTHVNDSVVSLPVGFVGLGHTMHQLNFIYIHVVFILLLMLYYSRTPMIKCINIIKRHY